MTSTGRGGSHPCGRSCHDGGGSLPRAAAEAGRVGESPYSPRKRPQRHRPGDGAPTRGWKAETAATGHLVAPYSGSCSGSGPTGFEVALGVGGGGSEIEYSFVVIHYYN